ncbi:MAG: STAS domain-containing protein [Solirubrobacteraceae bacterium]
MTVHAHSPQLPGVGLAVAVTERGTTTGIELQGECDLAASAMLRDAIRDAFEREPEFLVLDLGGVSFIDSSGIHLVVELAERSVARHVNLAIIPGPKPVHRVFELSQLADQLPFVGLGRGCRGPSS